MLQLGGASNVLIPWRKISDVRGWLGPGLGGWGSRRRGPASTVAVAVVGGEDAAATDGVGVVLALAASASA